jgi:hypothetical protein
VAAINGCPYKEPNDPGNLQFDWLEVQLNMYRKRGMQVRSSLSKLRQSNFFPQVWMSGEFDGGSLWVTNYESDQVTYLHPQEIISLNVYVNSAIFLANDFLFMIG